MLQPAWDKDFSKLGSCFYVFVDLCYTLKVKPNLCFMARALKCWPVKGLRVIYNNI
jgi:hypothetical protein